jgi:DNA-binding IclR family transcriptional regulator
MLALKTDQEVESLYLDRLTALTPRTLTSRAELLMALAGVREGKHATESEESTLGVCCIGVASRARGIIYGLSITVPVARAQAPDLAPKFLPVLSAILSRLDASLATAEWFQPGALTGPAAE